MTPGSEQVGDVIVRVVFEDQLPQHVDPAQAVRDSLIRYAQHFGLRYDPLKAHTQWGTRWKVCWCRDDHYPPGQHMRQASPMVTAVRIEAIVTGRRAA